MQNREKPVVRFQDRTDAGRQMADHLRGYLNGEEPVVLAIPPDGVPVASALAQELNAPFDLIVSRRIIAPGYEEETLGAVTPDRTLVVNKPLVTRLGLSGEEVDRLSIPAWADAQRAHERYRGPKPYPSLQGRTVIIVGDGLTSGYTMMAALIAVRKLEPARIVLAVPVAAVDALERLRSHADDLVSMVISRDDDFSVDQYYARYDTPTDQEVEWTMQHFTDLRPPQSFSETF